MPSRTRSNAREARPTATIWMSPASAPLARYSTRSQRPLAASTSWSITQESAPDRALSTSTRSTWDAVHAVNLKGTFFASQAAVRHMLANGYGRIINIASQLAVTSGPNRAVYASTKGGIVAITKSLAIEWAPQGVTVNAVGPGPTETPMTQRPDPARSDAAFLVRSPIGRRLQPEEIAGAVVFLASEQAGAVNGHHLLVDGAWSVS